MPNLYGAIEAGGTKFICAVGTGPHDIELAQFPTLEPDATMPPVIDFFRARQVPSLAAIGIGSFGPVDLHPTSPTYGHITSTPKPGWQNFDLAGAVRSEIHVPIGFDTDVASSALGEARWGAASQLSDFVYITVGTGIGGAAVVGGHVLHGLIHSEMGHLRIPHDTKLDPFAGICPFHGDCWEGLAAGPAMKARWDRPAQDLPVDHPAWALEAHYVALGLVNLVFTLSPQRFIIGGGVMQQPQMFPLVRKEFAQLINNYLFDDRVLAHLDTYIVPPALEGSAGALGCFVLAERAELDARAIDAQ
jgi:fructokinase